MVEQQAYVILDKRDVLLAVGALGDAAALLVLVDLLHMDGELVGVEEDVEANVAGEDAPLMILYYVGPQVLAQRELLPAHLALHIQVKNFYKVSYQLILRNCMNVWGSTDIALDPSAVFT